MSGEVLEAPADAHERGRPSGLTLVKTRRMRRPWTGEAGKLSTCIRVSSLRHDEAASAISAGRKLARAARGEVPGSAAASAR